MVSMFADGQVLQPDECQSLGDKASTSALRRSALLLLWRHSEDQETLLCVFFCCLFKYTSITTCAREAFSHSVHLRHSQR